MTASTSRPSLLAGLHRRPLTRVLVYYALVAASLPLLERYAPDLAQTLRQGEAVHARPGGLDAAALLQPSAPVDPGPLGVGASALVAMFGAFALMLPVVWVYQFTRRKRGYQQSLVQTLIILPVVVAAVVGLVRNSVALAFSLGGIVGAVAFRHRLEDTKDAVYVFLAIVVGLAAGVQVFQVALSLSVFYNVVALALWYTDFGRVPGELTGAVGQRRVELARDVAAARGKESSEFLAVVDEQILQSMTPSQLAALTKRALERQHKLADKLDDTEDRAEYALVVALVPGASEEGLRRSVEQALEREAKSWRLDTATGDDAGRIIFRYSVRPRKSVPRALLLETLRRATIGQADRVTLE